MSYDDFFPEDPVIPSTVTSRGQVGVHSPDYDEVYEKHQFYTIEKYGRCGRLAVFGGKWMLFHDCVEISLSRGLTRQDFAWQFIKRLVENNSSSVTGIYSAVCTTAWMGKRDVDPNATDGVICCFTVDYSDKGLVKKAADAIREAYHYPKYLYYKTDQATFDMKYRHLGSECVSIYKHNIRNVMYERDPTDPIQWKFVQF